MPKQKFVPKKFQLEESEKELSEEDKKNLEDFKSGQSLKNNNSQIQPDKQVRKPVQKIYKNQNKKKQSVQPKEIVNKENDSPQQQRNNQRTKSQKNPDKNLNKSILNSRKKKKHVRPTGLLKLPFQRLVKHITNKEQQERQDFQEGLQHYRYSREAISLLQCNAEGYLIEVFQDSYLLTNHAKRVTLMNRDLFLARRIRGPQLIFSLKFQKFNFL